MTGKYIITIVVAFIPELFFSWIIGKTFSISMWYVWIGLQILKVFLWILRRAIEYVLWHLVWKNELIDSTYCSLVQHRYPNPQKYFGSPVSEYKDVPSVGSGYLSDVMWDDEVEIKTRLDAAQAYGTVKGMTHTQNILENMRMEKVMFRAVEKYHKVNFSGGDYQVIQLNDEEGS